MLNFAADQTNYQLHGPHSESVRSQLFVPEVSTNVSQLGACNAQFQCVEEDQKKLLMLQDAQCAKPKFQHDGASSMRP